MSPEVVEGVVYQAACLVLWFFAYSFLGWLWEVVYSLVKHRRFVNRGFVYGPVCPIYGAGALMAIVVVGPLGNPFAQFVLGGLLAGVMEFATSWVMERLFHARWWDYTGYFGNIQGRVCLLGVCVFGLMAVLVDHVVHPLVAQATRLLDPWVAIGVAGVLLAVFAADFVSSAVHMHGFNERLDAVQGRLAKLAGGAYAAAGSAAVRVREHAAEAAERLGDFKEAAGEGLRLLRDAEWRSDMVDQLLDLATERFSRFERKTMRDARFKPTRNTEALEWLRDFAFDRERSASRRGVQAQGDVREEDGASGPKDA